MLRTERGPKRTIALSKLIQIINLIINIMNGHVSFFVVPFVGNVRFFHRLERRGVSSSNTATHNDRCVVAINLGHFFFMVITFVQNVDVT